MKNGKSTIWITMDLNLYFDVVKAVFVGRYLKYEAIKSDTVVVSDGAIKVLTEDILNG